MGLSSLKSIKQTAQAACGLDQASSAVHLLNQLLQISSDGPGIWMVVSEEFAEACHCALEESARLFDNLLSLMMLRKNNP